MIWKTRDTDGRNNAVYYNTASRHRFLTVIDAGSRQSSWISLNERGFAILNSAVYDLVGGSTGLSNGTFMTFAAGTCATVAEFERLLDSTNVTGRRTAGNFAVMDSTGAAAVYEAGGFASWKYDATDSAACPEGYILRTNFSIAGGGDVGSVRYERTRALFEEYSAGDSITPKTLLRYQMRDLADVNGVPYPLPFHGTSGSAPYGYIPVDQTICRSSSASAAVIHGVRAGESPLTSTFWVILGSPASGVAVPYWPVGGPPVPSADLPTSALTNVANQIYARISGAPTWPAHVNTFKLRDDNGNGVFRDLFLAEDVILGRADTFLAQWRAGACPIAAVQQAESAYAAFALAALIATRDAILDVQSEAALATVDAFSLLPNYPNPFNPSTTIRFGLPIRSHVNLTVFTTLGQRVATLVDEERDAGIHEVRFDATGLASGMYLYQLRAGPFVETRGLTLVR